MSEERTEADPKIEPEKVEVDIELPKLRPGQPEEDAVETFSRGFERELRRILGENYIERSKRTT